MKERIKIIEKAQKMIIESDDIGKKMSVVGEEGISIDDMVVYLKGEFYDAVYLQQNAYDKVDTATSMDRQNEQLGIISKVLDKNFKFDDREKARNYFLDLTDKIIQLNYLPREASIYGEKKQEILNMIEGE